MQTVGLYGILLTAKNWLVLKRSFHVKAEFVKSFVKFNTLYSAAHSIAVSLVREVELN